MNTNVLISSFFYKKPVSRHETRTEGCRKKYKDTVSGKGTCRGKQGIRMRLFVPSRACARGGAMQSDANVLRLRFSCFSSLNPLDEGKGKQKIVMITVTTTL